MAHTYVRCMVLRWEQRFNDLYVGLPDGQPGPPLAQVAHVYSAGGKDLGWVVLLLGHGELFDHCGTSREAMEVAEAAIDPGMVL